MPPSGLTVIVHATDPAAQLVDDRAYLCRDGACATGVVPQLGTGPGALSGPSFNGSVFVLADPTDGTEVYADTSDGPFVDGEVYELALLTTANAKVFDLSGPARFDLDPCGGASASLVLAQP